MVPGRLEFLRGLQVLGTFALATIMLLRARRARPAAVRSQLNLLVAGMALILLAGAAAFANLYDGSLPIESLLQPPLQRPLRPRAGARLCDAVQAGAIKQRLAALSLPAGGTQGDGAGAGARVVGERIRRRVERESFGSGARPPVVTVSVGVASMHEHAVTVDGLVEEADRGLYGAKARDKNCVEVAESEPRS